jgi:hypothetical protein
MFTSRYDNLKKYINYYSNLYPFTFFIYDNKLNVSAVIPPNLDYYIYDWSSNRNYFNYTVADRYFPGSFQRTQNNDCINKNK